MTSKELLYVEDALGHEKFMKTSSCSTSSQLKDVNLSNYVKQLEQIHADLFNNFFNSLLSIFLLSNSKGKIIFSSTFKIGIRL